MIAPFVYRFAASGGVSPFTPEFTAIQQYLDQFIDPNSDPGTLSSVLSESSGETITVADVEAPFELRKLMWRISRAPTGSVEDQDVLTFHFLKAPGGTPTNSWDTSDYTTIETAMGTFFDYLKAGYPSWMHSDQFRWYADGPDFYELRSTPAPARYVPKTTGNPARRVTEVDVAGTSSATVNLAPQVAITVTEKTSSRLHWGRFYVPAILPAYGDQYGRIASASCDGMAGAVQTLYNTCRAASLIPVVFSIQKPERLKANGATLPAVGAVAYEITSVQVDNLFDIIRRRRYSSATYRKVDTLT